MSSLGAPVELGALELQVQRSDHSATLPPLKNKRKVRLFVSWVFLTFGPVSGLVADTCSFSRWQICAVYDVKRVCAITV